MPDSVEARRHSMGEYQVQFEVFEGPLDLLLYLVKKEEVDIYQVNLTQLATQFIQYVEVMRELDLDIAGEFLVMAATLMYIKSRELLPVEQQVTAEGEEDEENDPRWELIRKLVEYKKFKDAAAQLRDLENRQDLIYPRQAAKLEGPVSSPRLEVNLFDLVGAVSAILKRFQARGDSRDIFEDRWSVSEKIELLRQTLTERLRLEFSELFADTTSRTEVVVTFLAVLELIRLRQIVARQPEVFGEIEISLAPPEPDPQPAAPIAPSSPDDAPPEMVTEPGQSTAPVIAIATVISPTA